MTITLTQPLPPNVQAFFSHTWKICPTCWHITYAIKPYATGQAWITKERQASQAIISKLREAIFTMTTLAADDGVSMTHDWVDYCGCCGTCLKTYTPCLLTDIGRIWGIGFCPSCSTFYGSQVQNCPICTATLYCVIQPENMRQTIAPPQHIYEVAFCPECDRAIAHGMSYCAACGRLIHVVRSYDSERPMLNIKLRTGEHSSQANIGVLVDSGSCSNIFHGSWAVLLGVTLDSTKTISISGVTPGAAITGYLATVQLGIDQKFYQVPVYFSFDLPTNVHSMLGRFGFFDRFIIEIDDGKKSLTLREAEVLKPRKYQYCPHCNSAITNEHTYCSGCGGSLFAPTTQQGFLTFPGLG